MPHPPRRAALQRLALWCAAGSAAALAGCGFTLRRPPVIAYRRLRLEGFAAGSPMATELGARLREAGVQLAQSPAEPTDAVLQVLDDHRVKRVVASTAVGQVRELQLRVHFQFRLATPAGRQLIEPTALALSRDLTTSETLALSKMQEEAELYAAMQSDIVQQVLGRLASAPKP